MKNLKYKIKCVVCKKEFNTNQPNQKYCCDKCRDKAAFENSGRVVNKFRHLSTGTVWKISEIQVATELMKKGYTVFYALSPDSYCDLVAVKNNDVLHIEARTGYMNKFTNKLTFPTQLRGLANIYGVFERNNEKVYFLNKNKEHIKL